MEKGSMAVPISRADIYRVEKDYSFGLFSVPAPPFRLVASGGVFFALMSTSWKLDGTQAQLELDTLRATLDLRDPASGLQQIQLGSLALPGNLLGIILKPHVDTTPS